MERQMVRGVWIGIVACGAVRTWRLREMNGRRFFGRTLGISDGGSPLPTSALQDKYNANNRVVCGADVGQRVSCPERGVEQVLSERERRLFNRRESTPRD